jgi:hypothetical protein
VNVFALSLSFPSQCQPVSVYHKSKKQVVVLIVFVGWLLNNIKLVLVPIVVRSLGAVRNPAGLAVCVIVRV